MASFGGLILTNKGRALQAKVQAGAPLHFTRIGVGDGNLGSSTIATLNALVGEKKSLAINKLKHQSGGKTIVGGMLSNREVAVGFFFREIGYFAQDPDAGEILYCYANAGAGAEYIAPGGGADAIEKQIDTVILTANAANVTADIASGIYALVDDVGDMSTVPTSAKTAAGAISELHELIEELDVSIPDGSITPSKLSFDPATQAELDAHLTDYVRQPGYAVTAGTANTYTVTTTPAPTSYVDGMGIAVRIHAANTGASTINWNGLGAKAIVDLKGNALTPGKLPIGTRVSLRYSSAAGNFQLQGEGGEYGTAGAADVLVGKTIGTDAGLVAGTMPARVGPYQGTSIPCIASSTAGVIDLKPFQGYWDGNTYGGIYAATFVKENIRAGVDMFGLVGTLGPGTPAASGSFTGTTSMTVEVTGLTFTPKFIYIEAVVSGYLQIVRYGDGVTYPLNASGNKYGSSINLTNGITSGSIWNITWTITANGFTCGYWSGVNGFPFRWLALG